jgi:hypothetical protein
VVGWESVTVTLRKKKSSFAIGTKLLLPMEVRET